MTLDDRYFSQHTEKDKLIKAEENVSETERLKVKFVLIIIHFLLMTDKLNNKGNL